MEMSSTRNARRALSSLVSLMAIAAGGLAIAPQAEASGVHTYYLSNECDGLGTQDCVYYGTTMRFNSNEEGAAFPFAKDIPNFGGYSTTYNGGLDVNNYIYVYEPLDGWTAGQGQAVKNNAASVNNGSTCKVRIYYNSYYSGAYQTIGVNTNANLNSTLKNENASAQGIC
jgi:hypothetical protein